MKFIAEFCQNHNGDFEILKRMIHEAAEGGATHGKIQTIFANDLSFRKEFENGESKASGEIITIKRPYQEEYDRLKGLELSYEQQNDFVTECNKAGIIPLTTAFNLSSVNEISKIGWKSIKIASYDCGSLPLIKKVAKHFDEIIISTGATYDEEILNTASFLKDNNINFSFLHCVTVYPTPLNMLHLNRMKYLKEFTPSFGLSEHTETAKDGVKALIAATYLGADLLERHFTVLKPEESRDGKVSINKEHIKEVINFSKLSKDDQKAYIENNIPEFESMLGEVKRELTHAELLNRDYYRGRFCNKINDRQVFNWEDEANSL